MRGEGGGRERGVGGGGSGGGGGGGGRDRGVYRLRKKGRKGELSWWLGWMDGD